LELANRATSIFVGHDGEKRSLGNGPRQLFPEVQSGTQMLCVQENPKLIGILLDQVEDAGREPDAGGIELGVTEEQRLDRRVEIVFREPRVAVLLLCALLCLKEKQSVGERIGDDNGKADQSGPDLEICSVPDEDLFRPLIGTLGLKIWILWKR